MTETTGESQANRVECRATKDTAVRLFIVTAMLLALGIYCGYDGYYAKDEKGNEKYPYAAPGEDINTWAKWGFNHYGPFVFIPAGLVLAFLAVRSLTTHIEANDTGIGYLGKDKIPWGQITSLDASKLKDKQILYLHHGDGGKMTLDAYKITHFKDLVAFVETHVPESAKPEGGGGADASADDEQPE